MKGQPNEDAGGRGGRGRDEVGGGPDPVNRPVAIIGVVPMKVSRTRHAGSYRWRWRVFET
jgi:hypothetical protein